MSFTRLPWGTYKTEEGIWIACPEGMAVAQMRGANKQANADFIVLAVNSHADMYAALEELISLADDGAYLDLADIHSTAISRKIRAALAKARGEA